MKRFEDMFQMLSEFNSNHGNVKENLSFIRIHLRYSDREEVLETLEELMREVFPPAGMACSTFRLLLQREL